ncbi:MAG: class I SAM-dependent methyltransferase [Ignavibacteriaceae bacterium]|jgi:SAM-dependent methyltransferase|nr:class I SAM-dependent methyltransferase [Ignavibacteriaceae bacterium]
MIKIPKQNFWDIGTLPFIWKPLSSPTNEDEIPNELPFGLRISNETGLLMQAFNSIVPPVLALAYSKGSMISGMMDEEGIGKKYAEDFLDFLKKDLKRKTFDHLKVLEIGCGTGYLLHRMEQLGGKCLGIEPGRHGQNAYKKYGVRVIQDFFPSNQISGTFDIIIFYALLEHIEDPIGFLAKLKKISNPNSKILLSVPDCETYIEKGDISILLHEHWNYFTRQSLYNLLIFLGSQNIRIQKSEYGGALYASAQLTQDIHKVDSEMISGEIKRSLSFIKAAKEVTDKLSSFVRQVQIDGKTLAVYVPSRAINAFVGQRVDLSHCRFFDDNPLLHGTYFPAVNIQIEPRQSLIDSPTDVVIIMSHSFGSKIEEQLKPVLPPKTIIKTWKDMFS